MSWKWLEETRKLQTQSFGKDPSTLEGDELAEFVIWNHTALIDEMSEFLGEIKWKPWVSSGRGTTNRDAAIGELVDVAHFLANLAVAMGCTDEEWISRYQAKMAVNAARQRDGYTGENKCPVCRRALDDAAVLCTAERCAEQ